MFSTIGFSIFLSALVSAVLVGLGIWGLLTIIDWLITRTDDIVISISAASGLVFFILLLFST